jgi:hypothetical protein
MAGIAGTGDMVACPSSRNRLPGHIGVYDLTKPKAPEKRVVTASSLSPNQLDAVDACESSTRSSTLRGKRTSESSFKVSQAKDAECLILADRVAEVCFPVDPVFAAYRMRGRTRAYIALHALQSELGVDVGTIMEELPHLHEEDVVRGSIEGCLPDVEIRERSPPFPHIHTFVSISVAVAFHPDHRSRIVASVCGDAVDLPAVPLYAIWKDGATDSERWVSALDIAIAADDAGFSPDEVDDDDEPLTFAKAMVERGAASGTDVCNAVIDVDGRLQRCVACTRGSGSFIKVGWLQRKQGNLWQAIAHLAAPQVPGSPVLIQTNPAKTRPRSIPKGSRISTIPMTLKRRLAEPDVTLPMIRDTCTGVR